MKALTFPQGALCVAMALMVSVGVAHGRTIRVDDDGVADYRSIKAAVAAAQSGDTIAIASGRYTGPDARDIVIAGKSLTIRSGDPNSPGIVAATVIDCQADDDFGHRFIEISPGTGVELTLAGLTIVNGSGGFAGGAVLCEGANLSVVNCTFNNNSVQWWGGALSCVDSSAVVKGCTFTNNASVAMHGGAVFSRDSVVSLTHCTFLKNTGNAVQSYDSNLTIVRCTFESNVGREGGALSSYGTLEVPAYLNLAGCTFVENVADATGGAVHGSMLEATITTCTFRANIAGADGGALYNHRSSPSINNCAFIRNTAGGLGGAIANRSQSSPEIIHATLVNNEADRGGAVAGRYQGHVLISHSILWNNRAARGNNVYLEQSTQGTVEYSDVETAQLSIHAEPGSALNWGPGNLNANPLFSGAHLDDYHLSPDSPCVDSGDPDYVPDFEATDVDGHPRLFGKSVDMGSYEYQGLGPVYRFWSPTVNKHFYTMSGLERDKLINKFSDVWQFEEIAYYAFYKNTADNLVPVYRFWSPTLNSHMWTTREAERAKLIEEYPDVWTYEGIAFYAYAPGKQPLGAAPVYRFWSAKRGYHFYTMSESEKGRYLTDYPNIWTFEGVAYYAYAKPYQPIEVTYDFAGGAEEVWYTMTLAAYVDGLEAEIDAPEVRLNTTSAWMRLKTDFMSRTVTLNGFRAQGQATQHSATIRQSGSHGLSIPFTMSVEAVFASQTPRGPFAVDPLTGTFADFADARESLAAEGETYSYNGSIRMRD
ncbi:MAG: choice-of-anchor Q domain-containing protein, partial [Planctomycetota bacterium]